jgi:acetyl esterase/lipase
VLRRSWPIVIALLVIAAVALLAAGTRAGRVAVATSLITLDAMGVPALHPGALVGPAPLVEHVFFASGERTIEGLVFRPRDGRPRGAIVLSMGVRAWRLESPEMEALGSDFARAGVVLMALDSPELRFDEIGPEQVEDLVRAFVFLRGQPYTDESRVGFLGFSVGGSLALLAAADARVADQVGFVDVVGAYHDVTQLLKDVTTGRAAGFRPSETSEVVIRKQVIDATAIGDDRALLLGIFYEGRDEDRGRVGGLGEGGRAVFDLLDNDDPERFQPLLDRVMAYADLEALLALSPSRVAADVRAPLRVLHSRRDRHVPFEHAERLTQAAARAEPRLLRFDAFDHVDPRLSSVRPALAADALRMYWYLYGLVRRLE